MCVPPPLDHDPIMISSLCLSMISSENRSPLFRIMLFSARLRSQRQMRVSDVRPCIKLAHGTAEADAAALDDIGAVANQFREMQVLLGDDHADAFLLHGQDRIHHLL